MTGTGRKPPYPSLWCGEHDRWEKTATACDVAFDPEGVSWLTHAVDADTDHETS